MRRIAVSALVFIFLFLFCSCFPNQTDFNDVKNMLKYPVCISAEVEQETTVRFKLNAYEEETLFTFTEPETLRLLSVKKNKDGYLAQYDGIESKLDSCSVLAVDSLSLALNAITMSETCSRQIKNDQNVLLFSIDGVTVLVYYDVEQKIITKIIAEANGQLFSYRILSVSTIQT